ncbi:capsular polysaccharide export protein, LipB/KpsS family [Halobacillus salinus]|uniref:capsular polysaccharide export protein, LipB/KpsS family n=1 Tax=Halobacillus salinus TaxID=192814 RepID=UPI0009A6A4FF|nr:glycosyltransferase [Halobacillus salinus]
MKYLIVNPFYNATNGVENYIRNTVEALNGQADVELFPNDKNLSKRGFQKSLYEYVTSTYGTEEVIIEAPEARSATLLLPKDYKVHLRLHCPLAVAQKYDGVKPDETVYSEELRVIHKAGVVSSPSYGLLEEMKDEINPENSFVFKNTYNKNINLSKEEDKEYDVVFLGRFQKLKGTEYINPILERLPKEYNVLLIGNNSSKFKFSDNVTCNVTVKEHIASDERFDLIGKAKTLMMLSRFENCSMVILESIAAGTVVSAWDVGGNSEIAPEKVMNIVPFEDIDQMATEIRRTCESKVYPSQEDFQTALDNIENDFIEGINSVVETFSSESFESKTYKGMDCSIKHRVSYPDEKFKIVSNTETNPFGERVLGFTISNEHIEEMWAPVVKQLGLEARYVCRRPLGFHSVFDNKFQVKDEEFSQYDWIKNTKRLLKNIHSYKPNKILFHNGLHPMYQDALQEVKKLNIPIIYSELGWFPQKNNVYFDRWGTNGQSYLASLTAEAFCRENINDNFNKKNMITGEHVLVVTQLENDTNLIVNSPKFKDNYNFVAHVIDELPSNQKIIVKTHPLDKHWEKLLELEDERVTVIKEGNLEELTENAKAVVGINSTVLIQSLKYDVNIYNYGHSLLDNKGVSISCLEKPLSQMWTKYLVGSRKRREKIIQGFKNRQINVSNLENASIEELVNHIAFEPFLLANQTDFTKLNSRAKSLKLTGEKSQKGKSNNKAKAQPNKKSNSPQNISEARKQESAKKTNPSLKYLWTRRFIKFKKNPFIVYTFVKRKIKNVT